MGAGGAAAAATAAPVVVDDPGTLLLVAALPPPPLCLLPAAPFDSWEAAAAGPPAGAAASGSTRCRTRTEAPPAVIMAAAVASRGDGSAAITSPPCALTAPPACCCCCQLRAAGSSEALALPTGWAPALASTSTWNVRTAGSALAPPTSCVAGSATAATSQPMGRHKRGGGGDGGEGVRQRQAVAATWAPGSPNVARTTAVSGHDKEHKSVCACKSATCGVQGGLALPHGCGQPLASAMSESTNWVEAGTTDSNIGRSGAGEREWSAGYQLPPGMEG